jgi:hypothetical protein
MFRRRRAPRADPGALFLGLRANLADADPAELGLAPSARFPRLWAAMLEIGLDSGTASLVALTGGIVGAGTRPGVGHAAVAFVDVLDAHLGLLQPVEALPLPAAGTIGFHALTWTGRLSAAAGEAELVDGTHPLATAFLAGNDLLTAVRLADGTDPG